MREFTRIARFVFVGTLNALIIMGIGWIMLWMHKDYVFSNVVAYVLAQIHNFVWCKYWIFPLRGDEKMKNKLWRQMMYFAGAFGVAYVSQLVFLLVLVECLHCNELLAQFFGLFIYGAINFSTNRYITFR